MTPKAATAFRDLIERKMRHGDGTLVGLLSAYQSCTNPVPTRHLTTLKVWSSRYGWQDRIARIEQQAAEQALADAAIIDAQTFLKSSQLLAERMNLSTPLHVDAVVKIRESVRKPQAQQAAVVGQLTTVVQIVAPESESV